MNDGSFLSKKWARDFLRASTVDRRKFLMGSMALGASAMLPSVPAFAADEPLPEFDGFPERLKGTGQLVYASSGGSLYAAERKAFLDYFEEHSGIKVVITQGTSTAKIRAQVETKNVEWDLVGLGRMDLLPLISLGEYFEPIDYSIVDWKGINDSLKFKESVGRFVLAAVIAYRADVFPTGPASWSEFFDTAAFPGPRGWKSGTMGLAPFIEGALLADGVPLDQVYPLDIDRALKSLDRIKNDLIFWNSSANSRDLIANKEVVMGTAWNGPVGQLMADGLPVGMTWNGAMHEDSHFAVVKGGPNVENTMKLIAFATSPIAQARLAMSVPYGYINDDAAPLVPDSRKAVLPSSHAAVGFKNNPEWWQENRALAIEKWAEWMLA